MNKVFAISFAIMASIAFYGAAFQNAPWHYGTTIICAFLSLLFFANGDAAPAKKL
jgi:hypothetical protein